MLALRPLALSVGLAVCACGATDEDADPTADAGGTADASSTDAGHADSEAGPPFLSGSIAATVEWTAKISCSPDLVAHSLGRFGFSQNGDLLFGGGISGKCTLYAEQSVDSEGYDAFAVRLAAADGTPVWVRRFGDASFQTAHRSVGSTLAGVAAGQVDWGGVTTSAPPGGSPFEAIPFVATLTEDAQPHFARNVGGKLASVTTAEDPSGGALVGVDAAGAIDLGTGPLQIALNETVVARFDASGQPLFVHHVSSAGSVRTRAVALRNGSAVILGFVSGAASFPGAPPFAAPAGAPFLVQLDATGAVTGSRLLDTSCELEQLSVAATWSAALGICPTLTVYGFSAAGTPTFQREFDAGIERAAGYAVDDGLLMAGTFTGTVDLDGIVLSSAGKRDAFVAKLDSTGHTQWALRFGDEWDQSLDQIALRDDLYVSGSRLLSGDEPGFNIAHVTRLHVAP